MMIRRMHWWHLEVGMHSWMWGNRKRMVHTFLVILLHMQHRICVKLIQGFLGHKVRVFLFVSAASLSLLFWIIILFFTALMLFFFRLIFFLIICRFRGFRLNFATLWFRDQWKL